jgi:hypothetical protein
MVVQELHRQCTSRPEGVSKNQRQQRVADQTGLSFSLVKNIIAGHANVTNESAEKLMEFLTTKTG